MEPPLVAKDVPSVVDLYSYSSGNIQETLRLVSTENNKTFQSLFGATMPIYPLLVKLYKNQIIV